MLKIKIFGKLTDVFRTTEYELDIQGIDTVFVLRSRLEIAVPELFGMTYIVVIDGKKTENEAKIFENSEIALLPPYSGG